MKRFTLIAFIGVIVLCSQVAFGQEANTNRVSNTQRQLLYFEKVEQSIFTLPFEFGHIQNEFVPEIHSKRLILAPNFPDRDTLQRDEVVIEMAFIDWIQNHSQEYTAYLKYLLSFIEDHK
jgi:hypothetical protein